MRLRSCHRYLTRLTCLVALFACTSATALILFAGIAAACEGTGEPGCTEAPAATTQAASSIGSTSATLNGSVNPHGCETTYTFKYGLTSSYGEGTIMGTAGNATFAIPVSNTAFSLKPSTTYHYQVYATNSKGTTPGGDVTFTTKAETEPPPPTEKPTVTTEAASGVVSQAAFLNGSVNPKGSATTYKFEYGTAKGSLTSSTSSSSAGSGTTSSKVSKAVTLEPATTYWFRISAANANGTSQGGELSFTTPALVTSWSIQPTPMPIGATSSNFQSVSCTASSACTGVGWYVNSSSNNMPFAERWNGTAWTEQTAPSPTGAVSGTLSGAACTSSIWCTAVGSYVEGSTAKPLAETWNGLSWALQTTPVPTGSINASLRDVSCTSSTACTAIGTYYTGSGGNLPLAMRWNGTAWTIQSMAIPSGAKSNSLKGVSCASSTACTAVGWYENSSGEWRTLIEFWNGSTWTLQTASTATGQLEEVSCTSSTACTAVGEKMVTGNPSRILVERWNGTSWTTQTSPEPSGSEAGVMHGVSCVSATSCTAVGFYYYGSLAVPLIERWNGSSWSVMAAPNPSGSTYTQLESVACTSVTECMATGYYRKSSGGDIPLAMKSS